MITIRRARADDAPTICATETDVSAIPGLLVSAPDEISPDSTKRMIEQLGDGVGCYMVAEDDAKVVGHAFLRPMDLRATSHVYRLTIVVHPSFWKRGVGRALMQALREWATASPLVERLNCWSALPTVQRLDFTSNFGFVEEGRLRLIE